MAYFNKIGLLVLNKDNTKFLVVRKSPNNVTGDYIMPGGQFEESSAEECIKNEIKEELNCEVDFSTLEYIDEYEDVAAGKPDKKVSIKLYQGRLLGDPIPSSEIKGLSWIGIDDQNNEDVSPIIRNKIIPDLIKKELLRK